MICENCGLDHVVKYSSGRFCSCKCARGFSTKAKRLEINQSVSQKLRGRRSSKPDPPPQEPDPPPQEKLIQKPAEKKPFRVIDSTAYSQGLPPRRIGEKTEALVLHRLIEAGYSVSIPFGGNLRYDFIIDTGQALLRAQVKTARLINGFVHFYTHSSSGGKHKRKKRYEGEIDLFLAYCPETGSVYELPIEEAKRASFSMNTPPSNDKRYRNTKLAEDYVFKSELRSHSHLVVAG